MGNKLFMIISFILGLTFLFQAVTQESILFKWIFLVLGVIEMNILFIRVGLRNYHKGLYEWVDD